MDSKDSRPARRVLAAGAVLLALALPAQAQAATGSLTFLEQRTDSGLTGARGVAVSPDGKSVYVAGQDSDAVVAYARGGNGALTNIGCFKDVGSPTACTATEGLDSPRFVAVSPDSRHVYVSGGDDAAVVIFQRDTSTGALSAPTCVEGAGSSASCPANVSAPLVGAEGIAVAPSGLQVYVAAQGSNAVAVLNRNGANGMLSFGSCHTQSAAAGCTTTSGLQAPRELAVAPDGGGVYVASATSNVVKAFDWQPGTGTLTDAGSAGGASLPVGVAVSPDGKHVYAGSAQVGDANSSLVRVYARDTSTSALTAAGCVRDGASTATGCTVAEGLSRVEGVAVAPDGANVYAAGSGDNAIAALTRDPASGALGALECLRDNGGGAGCGAAQGLANSHGVAVSPDGANVYVTGFDDNAVAVFQRTPAQSGGGGGGGTPPGTPTPEPPRPNPNCVNPVTLLVSCADPLGPPGICGPSNTILPQCYFPSILPTVCGPSNTLLTACVPPTNYVAACGGTGTVLPVCALPPPQLPQVCGPTGTLLPPCSGANNPILFCGGSGTALPACNLPPGAIEGTIGPNGTGEIEVTVGCNGDNASASTVQAAQRRPQTCTVDAVVADRKRTLISSLKQYAQREALYIIDGNLDWNGMQGRQVEELRQHEVAAFKTRANKLIDDSFRAIETNGQPFRKPAAVFALTNPLASPAYLGRYPLVAQFERMVGELVDQLDKALRDYKAFLDYQRSRRSSASGASATAAATAALVKPLARKRVKVKVGQRKRVRIKLSRAAVKQLRKGVAKRKAVAVRLLVTYKAKPYPVVRLTDFPIRVAKAKGKAKAGPKGKRRAAPKAKRRR